MRLPWRSKQVEPTARVVRDEWLEWLRPSNFSPLTTKGYRLTTDRLLERWPELPFTEFADEHDLSVFEIATEEWMRPDVGLTFVTIPGEKEMNSDFEVKALEGRIVGARIVKEAESRG